MKKRDLTKLVLLGMAAGSLVSASALNAHEGHENTDHTLLAHNGCGSHCGGPPQPPPSNARSTSQTRQNWADAGEEQQTQMQQPPQSQGQQPPQPQLYYQTQPNNRSTDNTVKPEPYNSYPQGRFLAADESDSGFFAFDDDEDDDDFLYVSEEDLGEDLIIADEDDKGDDSVS